MPWLRPKRLSSKYFLALASSSERDHPGFPLDQKMQTLNIFVKSTHRCVNTSRLAVREVHVASSRCTRLASRPQSKTALSLGVMNSGLWPSAYSTERVHSKGSLPPPCRVRGDGSKKGQRRDITISGGDVWEITPTTQQYI
nr:hypothetical protein CFP56_52899 [Quercus suber]